MPGSTSTRTRDLSNRKLAQNQTELSKQIVELRSMVSEQNELIRRLLEHKP
jgi:potassium voltage-gated channel Shal-related subfamily D protein 2